MLGVVVLLVERQVGRITYTLEWVWLLFQWRKKLRGISLVGSLVNFTTNCHRSQVYSVMTYSRIHRHCTGLLQGHGQRSLNAMIGQRHPTPESDRRCRSWCSVDGLSLECWPLRGCRSCSEWFRLPSQSEWSRQNCCGGSYECLYLSLYNSLSLFDLRLVLLIRSSMESTTYMNMNALTRYIIACMITMSTPIRVFLE